MLLLCFFRDILGIFIAQKARDLKVAIVLDFCKLRFKHKIQVRQSVLKGQACQDMSNALLNDFKKTFLV